MGIEMGRDYDGEKRAKSILDVTDKRPDAGERQLRFVNKDKSNIAAKHSKGYRFVDKKDVEVPGQTEEQFGENTSSRVEVGDLVLMETSKEDYDRRKKMKTDVRTTRSRDTIEHFRSEAARHGIEIETDYVDPSKRR